MLHPFCPSPLKDLTVFSESLHLSEKQMRLNREHTTDIVISTTKMSYFCWYGEHVNFIFIRFVGKSFYRTIPWKEAARSVFLDIKFFLFNKWSLWMNKWEREALPASSGKLVPKSNTAVYVGPSLPSPPAQENHKSCFYWFSTRVIVSDVVYMK